MRVLGFVIASLIAFPSSPANAAAVYWNLFNLEGESSFSSVFATYGTLNDMLNDTNRLASYSPIGTDLVASRNVVGTGAFFVPDPVTPVPLPASGMFLLVATAGSAGWWRRSRRAAHKIIL